MSTVKEMRDEGLKPSPFRALATRFRNGETLTPTELRLLRDDAAGNGNEILAARCREELRAAQEEVTA